ncbi:VWA domain-containing protein, partial [Hydrogenophaga atypica]
VVINPDNTVTYTPNANYVGTDSFSYTVTSPAGVTETATVTVSVTPQLSVVLSEEGLSGGIADALGNPTDTTDLAALTQALPMVVTAATGPSDLKSDGAAVVWNSVNTATGLVLTGQAGGKDVVRVDFNNTDNTYKVELLGPLDHESGDGENLLGFNIDLTTAANTSLNLQVTVEDDAPSDDVLVQASEMVALQDTNLMLVLDTSQSMSAGTPSQLSQAVDAAKLLLDSYDAYGDVRVRLVVFDTLAKTQGSAWMTVAEAKVALDAVQLGSWTNYDAALANAMDAFGSPGKIDGAQNVSYFLTDGAPSYGDGNNDVNGNALVNAASGTGDVGISAAEEAIWRDFLTNNDITSYALGFGGDFSAAARAQLDPIAYNGATGVDMAGIRVGGVGALADMLLNLSASSVSGNIIGAEGRDAVTNELETVALGADGGHIYSVTFLGGLFIYDDKHQAIIKVGGSDLVHTFDATTGNLVIGQTLGSVSFAVNVFTGAYEYRGVVGNTELVKLELIDNDRDRGDVDLSLTVNYNPDAVPTVLSAVVSEEGLSVGSPDAVGIPTDLTNTAATTGFLAADVTSVTGPVGLTSGGEAVTWSSTTTATGLTLTGQAGGESVMEVVFNNTNNTYSVQLLKPLDHPNTGGEDVLNFSVNATTSSGAVELKIAVEDDAPTSGTQLVNSVVGPSTEANVMLVLDRSGSMSSPHGPTLVRWDKVVEAANNLLDTFAANGETMVRLVSFDNTATTHGTTWLTVTEAKAIINAMPDPAFGPGTNYDAALNVAMSAFSTTTGRLADANNYSYFLTDGVPNFGDGNTSALLNLEGADDIGVSSAEETIWKNFLESNQIVSQALGFSASYSAAEIGQLDPIAYNGVTRTELSGVHVPNPNDLSAALVGLAPGAPGFSGTVVGALGADATTGQSETVSLGGDGGHIHSVGLLGGTFTYNAATDSVSKTGGAGLTHSFNAATDVLTIDDAATNQSLSINMVTGAYTYSAPTGTITKASVVLVDGDGDQGSVSLTLAVVTKMGTVYADTLVGTDGADVIVGGASADTLTGAGGADTFVWLRGDGGNLLVRDTIKDFQVGNFDVTVTGANAADRLDLSNFLVGATADNIGNYLSVVQVGANAEIRISTQGGFVNGAYSSVTTIHNGGTIVLEGVTLSGSNLDNLNQLLNSGQLVIG